MSKLVWDKVGERLYETGVSKGVLYPQDANGTYPMGYAWNGLTSFSKNPTGGEANPIYADNIKYLNLISVEEFEGSIGAYFYPDAFAECNGERELIPGLKIGQQPRKPFGFCCQTLVGNDTEGNDHGYTIQIVYGAMATPSERTYDTVNDSPEPAEMSWDITTTPVAVSGFKPTASLSLYSGDFSASAIQNLEDVLYGTDGTNPRLPLPDEVASILGGTVVNVNLDSLTIGSLTLSPEFSSDRVNYTAESTVSSAAVSADASDSSAAIAITVNGNSIANEGTATFVAGENTIAITVSKGSSSKTYTVKVTYTA